MEDVDTRRGIVLSLSKLGCGLEEFNFRKISPTFDIFYASWNDRVDV